MWCSLGVQIIICFDGLVGPLYLWAPMLCILLLYGSSPPDSTTQRQDLIVQGDQKVSAYLIITMQKVTGNVQSVPRQSPDIY
jgi:hypothetical protein